MRIFTNETGDMYVNAISQLHDGTDVEGHLYYTQAGVKSGAIQFQRGPIQEAGVNGITNEALLTVLIHRTKFLDSKFPCPENKAAIQSMDSALAALDLRTTRRQARGVEGLNLA